MNRFRAAWRHCGWMLLSIVVCLSAGDMVRGDDDLTARYFDQLRQRRLFGLAEGYCLSRLADEKLPLERRTVLTIELSRTFSQHATYTSGKEQAELWKQSTGRIDELLDSQPENPLRLLLETQRALALARQGENLRWQVVLFPFDESLRPQAVGVLDETVAQLKAVQKAADEQTGKRLPRRASPGATLSRYELRTLSLHLRHQIGRMLIERARLEPPGSPDRVAALMEAETWLEPLASGMHDEPLSLESRLLLAELSRLRGDRRQAADVVKSMKESTLTQALRDGLTALKARLLLDVDRAPDAAQLLSRYRIERRRLPGELQFLQVEALSALWEVADQHSEDELAAQLMEQLEAHAERADSEVGGFWAYRCRLLVETTLETKRYGVELAAVVREARGHYAAGRTQEATQAYGRAFAAAQRDGKDRIAMEIGYVRASVELESQAYEKAAQNFRQLAEKYPESPRAASAHLLSAYGLGRSYQQQRTRARRERYTDALMHHREQYPGHETTTEATWMLALLEEQRLQVTRALKLYREIDDGHARGPAAQVAIARCYEKILDRLRELERPVEAWENDAIARLEQIAASHAGKQQPLSVEQTEVGLRLARICLNRAEPDYERAERLLDGIEASRRQREQRQDAQAETDEIKRRRRLLHQAATQLRIVTLAGRDRIGEAEALVQTLSESKPRDVLGILDGLSEVTAGAGAATRHRLGELQLSAARNLDERRGELGPTEQQRLDHCLAQAYVATGRSTRAIEIYERLLAGAPKDRQLRETIAALLTECGTRECVQQAKLHWRTLESLSKAGEADWMKARYHVAFCSCALKQYDECRKLLAVTRLVYPRLGGDELRAQFAELEKRLPDRE